MKKLFPGLLLTIICLTTFAQKNTNERAEWFTDSRFGMFIHWGVYSGAEGYWKGEKLRNQNDYAEWLLYRNRIDRDEYDEIREQWYQVKQYIESFVQACKKWSDEYEEEMSSEEM